MFLSNVFPLGEKSGVNLRGNFNIAKGTLIEEKEKDDVDMKDKTGAEVGKYTTFSRRLPSLLLTSASNCRRLPFDILVSPTILHQPSSTICPNSTDSNISSNGLSYSTA